MVWNRPEFEKWACLLSLEFAWDNVFLLFVFDFGIFAIFPRRVVRFVKNRPLWNPSKSLIYSILQYDGISYNLNKSWHLGNKGMSKNSLWNKHTKTGANMWNIFHTNTRDWCSKILWTLMQNSVKEKKWKRSDQRAEDVWRQWFWWRIGGRVLARWLSKWLRGQ